MSKVIVCNGAKHIGIESTIPYISKYYTNGEVSIQLPNGNVDGHNVSIIQSFDSPNTNLMELMITIDACRRSGAKDINIIIPYFPYSRNDQRHSIGTPISAKVVADMLKSVNPTTIISFDLHASQIQGFFDNTIQFKHVHMGAFFKHHITKLYPTFGDNDWTFVSPDSGAVKRTKNFAMLMDNKNICNIAKYREKDQEVESMILMGDVENKNVCIFDDIIDTGGTINMAIRLLKSYGAEDVIALATHGILSAANKVHDNLDEYNIFITNSLKGSATPTNTTILPIKNFIYDIIYRLDRNMRLGELNSTWSEN